MAMNSASLVGDVIFVSNDAIEFSKGKPSAIIDGAALSRLIGDVQKSTKIQPQMKGTACPIRQCPLLSVANC